MISEGYFCIISKADLYKITKFVLQYYKKSMEGYICEGQHILYI